MSPRFTDLSTMWIFGPFSQKREQQAKGDKAGGDQWNLEPGSSTGHRLFAGLLGQNDKWGQWPRMDQLPRVSELVVLADVCSGIVAS